MKVVDLTNQKFGRLTAIKYLGASKWLCKCDCGNEHIVLSELLQKGNVKSCGCINKDRKANRKKQIMIEQHIHFIINGEV